MKINRRTFEALKYPEGSEERERLNKSPITSEYAVGCLWQLSGKNFSKLFKRRTWAIKYMKEYEKEKRNNRY